MRIERGSHSFEIEPFEHLAYWEGIAKSNWEEETYTIIDRFVTNNSITMDVGSWAGPVALYLASISKKVYALEPDPAIFPQLVHNISINPSLLSRIEAHSIALATTDGSLPLYARDRYGQSSSSLIARSRDTLSETSCKTQKLESFLSEQKIQHIDFIKLDIEGGEFALLTEWSDVLSQLNFPTLLVSFHYWHLKESIYLQKINNSFISRVMEKLERLFSITFYKKSSRKIIRDSLNVLSAYRYIYRSNGEELTLEQLITTPELIKEGSFVFTQQKW